MDSCNACNQASVPVVCRSMDTSNSQLLGVLGLSSTFPSKLPPKEFVTLLEEDQVTAIGNMHKKFGKDRVCSSRDILADKHTDMLITILRNCSRGHKITVGN